MVRVPWQDTYLFQRTAAFTTQAAFTAGGKGVAANVYGLPCVGYADNVPQHPGGQKRRADSKAMASTGDQILRPYSVAFALTFELTAPLLATFAQLLFHGGMTQGAGPAYLKSCVPYTTSTPVWYGNVLREMNATTATSLLAYGLIVGSLRIYGAEGGAWLLDVGFVGQETNLAFAAGSVITAYPADEVLRFQDTSLVFFDTPPISNFDCMITASPKVRHWDERTPYGTLIGPLTVGLTFTTPWDGPAQDGAEWVSAAGTTGNSYPITMTTSRTSGGNTHNFTIQGRIEADTATVLAQVEDEVQVGCRMLQNSTDPILTVQDYVDRS